MVVNYLNVANSESALTQSVEMWTNSMVTLWLQWCLAVMSWTSAVMSPNFSRVLSFLMSLRGTQPRVLSFKHVLNICAITFL